MFSSYSVNCESYLNVVMYINYYIIKIRGYRKGEKNEHEQFCKNSWIRKRVYRFR